MKEIKFRAWQPHSSLHRKPGMYEVTSLELYDESGGGEAFLALPGENAQSSEYLEDIKLMQYTGLKDKNSVEIYEGDILQCDDVSADYQLHAKVYWDEEEAIYKADRSGDGETCEFELWAILQEHQFVDVIGNIYENPELLAGGDGE